MIFRFETRLSIAKISNVQNSSENIDPGALNADRPHQSERTPPFIAPIHPEANQSLPGLRDGVSATLLIRFNQFPHNHFRCLLG